MILANVVVDLPKPPHKIYLAPSPRGTIYVQIDSKSFIQDAQSDMPARVSIGKLCLDDNTKLHPNERYYELFEPEKGVAMKRIKERMQAKTEPVQQEDSATETTPLHASTATATTAATAATAATSTAAPKRGRKSRAKSKIGIKVPQPKQTIPQPKEVCSQPLNLPPRTQPQDFSKVNVKNLQQVPPLYPQSKKKDFELLQQDSAEPSTSPQDQAEPSTTPQEQAKPASAQPKKIVFGGRHLDFSEPSTIPQEQAEPASAQPKKIVFGGRHLDFSEPSNPTQEQAEPASAQPKKIVFRGRHLDFSEPSNPPQEQAEAASEQPQNTDIGSSPLAISEINNDSQDDEGVALELRSEHQHLKKICVGSYIALKQASNALDLDSLLHKSIAQFGQESNVSIGQILDLAAYTTSSHYDYHEYAINHYLFENSQRILDLDDIVKLLPNLANELPSAFFDEWNKHFTNCDEVLIRFESANTDRDTVAIEMAENWPYEDRSHYPCLGVAVASTTNNCIPLMYADDCASIADAPQLQKFVDKIRSYGYKKMTIAIDGDTYQDEHFKIFEDDDIDFMMHLPGSHPLIANLITNYSDRLNNDPLLSITSKGSLRAKTIKHEFHGRKRYFHLFYSSSKYSRDIKVLEKSLVEQELLLISHKNMPIDFDYPELFENFHIAYADDGKTLLDSMRNEEAISKKYQSCGYFCIITSRKIKAHAAYSTYKSHALSEKFFDSNKVFPIAQGTEMDMRCSAQGMLFILFISLILRVKLYCTFKDNQLTSRPLQHLVQKALAKLDAIEIFQPTFGRPYYFSPLLCDGYLPLLNRVGISTDQAREMIAQFCNDNNLFRGPSAPCYDEPTMPFAKAKPNKNKPRKKARIKRKNADMNTSSSNSGSLENYADYVDKSDNPDYFSSVDELYDFLD